ncbi:hypothetical protein [Pseudanabaena sp. PCC 6802]|uniref:hypothetical protein n=1 Tax=Pseudanabaena sp. PCC 6802 TaxID=118173 RepID=UPI00034D5F1E|nr:hypothetical protein [Pseudanabaena sp. PCC 6802]
MTVERWTDERLDRLATTVAENSEQIARNGEQIRELRELFSEMRSSQAMLQQEQSEASRQFMHMIGIISQQQSEIAGLRTETNRMLDILINQRQGEDDEGG